MKKIRETQSIKIELLGDSGVWKTNIINSILRVKFNEEEISTISSYKFKKRKWSWVGGMGYIGTRKISFINI